MSNRISSFDRQMAERRAEQGAGLPQARGAGYVVGVLCIVVGVGAAILTGGMLWWAAPLGVAVGLAAMGGETVTQTGLDNMSDAIEAGPQAVSEAAAMGFGTLILYVIIIVVLLIALFVALADAGQVAGVSL